MYKLKLLGESESFVKQLGFTTYTSIHEKRNGGFLPEDHISGKIL